MAAWQQASAVLIALIETLLPVEGAEGMLDEADEQRLGRLTLPNLPVRCCKLKNSWNDNPECDCRQLLLSSVTRVDKREQIAAPFPVAATG